MSKTNAERIEQRQVRNRELAALSRQRQKQYVQDLENQYHLLREENADLHARLEVLASENAFLRDQVLQVLYGQPPEEELAQPSPNDVEVV